jgi:DNA mismatch repair protein MutL
LTPSIQILEPQVANQIAAGETIERPVSVVKELVENALDAGAKQIDITIEGSGVECIRVRDDGGGIRAEDLEISILRHATSKIRKLDDLEALSTLGFRGEALPSIASVSRLEIVSRVRGLESGMNIQVEGGRQTGTSVAGSPVGTTVTVRDLFYNTPARRKFLRSQNTEFGRISEWVGRAALAHPEVAFTLAHPKQVVLQTSGRNDLRETIGAVFGADMARRMIPLKAVVENWTLSGYLSPPDLLRSNRQGEIITVNGRSVRSSCISQAILAGYHTLIPIKCYPSVILHLQTPPGEYDVNVHPTKLEVHFHREAEVVQFISAQIHQAIVNGGKTAERARAQNGQPLRERGESVQSKIVERKNSSVPDGSPSAHPSGPYAAQGSLFGVVKEAPVGGLEGPREQAEEGAGAMTDPAALVQPPRREASYLEDIWPLAQVLQTYILATDGKELMIIDQHAAHERINYEALWRRAKNSHAVSQELLVPVSLEFTMQEEQVVLEHLERLTDMGFILEHFGSRSYVLRAVPVDTGAMLPEELLHKFIDTILSDHTPPAKEKLLEEWIYLLACHQSIRAKETLSLLEMEQLIEQLRRTENPLSCPHGRPVMIRLTRLELEKRFHRV